MNQAKSFCELLREKRLAQRLTLREFCRRADEDPANFSRIERGLRTPPSDEVLSRYAKALNLEGEELRLFMDVGVISRRELPKDIPIEALVEKLPAVLCSIKRGDRSNERLGKISELTKKAFLHD